MMSTSLIDVIIPVYNGEQTIESAIRSIQMQTVRDIRILVINDGSTDATRPIVERLATTDPRVTLLNQANNGIVDALNTGLAASRADIIARHDADDLATTDRFETQLSYLYHHPDCAAVSGAVRHIDEDGRPLGPVQQLPSPDLADPDWYPQREPYLMHPFLMMRRAAVEAVGGYRYAYHAEDTDLYWRLQEAGRLINIPNLLGEYRIHAKSVTGASLVNGRIAALNSQLSGLSAKRRRAGRPDITFPKSALQECQDARSLEGIIRVGSRDLDTTEAERLSASVSAKLLELASYRPYEIELEDCAFIRETVVSALPSMTSDNRKYCSRMLSGNAARLAFEGNVSAALRLAPSRLYPFVAARVALRTAVPRSVSRGLRRAVGRTGFVK